jgi:hypothetical protein
MASTFDSITARTRTPSRSTISSFVAWDAAQLATRAAKQARRDAQTLRLQRVSVRKIRSAVSLHGTRNALPRLRSLAAEHATAEAVVVAAHASRVSLLTLGRSIPAARFAQSFQRFSIVAKAPRRS